MACPAFPRNPLQPPQNHKPAIELIQLSSSVILEFLSRVTNRGAHQRQGLMHFLRHSRICEAVAYQITQIRGWKTTLSNVGRQQQWRYTFRTTAKIICCQSNTKARVWPFAPGGFLIMLLY